MIIYACWWLLIAIDGSWCLLMVLSWWFLMGLDGYSWWWWGWWGFKHHHLGMYSNPPRLNRQILTQSQMKRLWGNQMGILKLDIAKIKPSIQELSCNWLVVSSIHLAHQSDEVIPQPAFPIVVTTSCFYRGYYAFSAFPVTTRMRNHFEHLSFMKLHYQLASIMGDSDGDGCFIFSEMKGNKPQNYI